MKAFRKTEKRKTETEGKSEGENAECVAFPFLLERHGRQCWAGHSEPGLETRAEPWLCH